LQLQAAECEAFSLKNLTAKTPKKKSMTEYFPQLLNQSLLKRRLGKALG